MNKKLLLPGQTKNMPLYLSLYEYYKERITDGRLAAGVRLPSVRRCAQELEVSRTTVEASYSQLAAEGYIIAKPQSGYYVAELDYSVLSPAEEPIIHRKEENAQIIYDFKSSSVDKESFDFALWRRYIKSALRTGERLLSYGAPQGEYDLRVSLCKYVSSHRGCVCSPEQIVVGAGVQSLIHILCALTPNRKNVALTSQFLQGRTIFEDHGINVDEISIGDWDNMIKKNIAMIYTSPSHIDAMGNVLPVSERLNLLSFARENGCLIIEDDYDSEFRYDSHPVPSLQGLDGGQNVVYFGTFSRLLLPSLRLSFMILPQSLIKAYEQRGVRYNQTASKAEQIALCQFIRDGHLDSQIRKARKLYAQKSRALCESAKAVFGDNVTVSPVSSGMRVCLQFTKSTDSSEELAARALKNGIAVKPLGKEGEPPSILLSCSAVNAQDYIKAMELLKNI